LFAKRVRIPKGLVTQETLDEINHVATANYQPFRMKLTMEYFNKNRTSESPPTFWPPPLEEDVVDRFLAEGINVKDMNSSSFKEWAKFPFHPDDKEAFVEKQKQYQYDQYVTNGDIINIASACPAVDHNKLGINYENDEEDHHGSNKLDSSVSTSLKIYVIGVPGHTRDHVAFWIPAKNIVFTGDALHTMGLGRSSGEAKRKDMWRSLRVLCSLPAETNVFTGSEIDAETFLLGAKAFLRPHRHELEKHVKLVQAKVLSLGDKCPQTTIQVTL